MKKISLCAVLIIMANFAYANDLTKTENYYPDGKYGIGSRFARKNPTIEKVKNNVRLTVHSYDNGPIHMDIHKYGGGIYFERRFEDHPLSEHGGWSRPPVTQQVNDFHGSIENGKLGVTNAKIYGVEMHPNDAYDAKDGGDHPYDIYTFTVDGESRYTSIREVEKPKPLPTPPNNPYNPNANNDNGNNRQAENGSNDNNSRENQTRQEQANGQGDNDAIADNGEVKSPQDTTKNGSGWGFPNVSVDLTANASATAGMGGESEVSVNLVKYDHDNGWQALDGGSKSTGLTTGLGIEASGNIQLTVGNSPTGFYTNKCVSGKVGVGGKVCVGVSENGPYTTLSGGLGGAAKLSASAGWTEEWTWGK